MRATYALVILTLAAYWLPSWPAGRDYPWWHLWAYSLSHASWWHLAINTFGLLSLGLGVERRLGPARLVALWLLCVPVAALGHAWMTPNGVVGASGGILGLAGAYAVLQPRWRHGMAMYAILSGVCGVFGLLPGVAHFAHLAGLTAGVVVARDER